MEGSTLSDVADVCSQHKLGLALKEFRLLHATSARGSLPMNKLIFPPALKYLPVWSLGEALQPLLLPNMQMSCPNTSHFVLLCATALAC